MPRFPTDATSDGQGGRLTAVAVGHDGRSISAWIFGVDFRRRGFKTKYFSI
jgi:hypothetical protein